jgi:hypothetical protein
MLQTTEPSGSPSASIFEEAEIIHAYTRADALRDGTLHDVSKTAAEAGFRHPVALTSAVWEDAVAWSSEDNRRQRTCQDEDGRLWDVLYMAHQRIKNTLPGVNTSTLLYTVYRVPRGGRYRSPRPIQLKIHVGPGDAGEPVITIMQPNET